MSEGIFWKSRYGAEVSPDLTNQEKELRDAFVKEFLLDHDAYAAAIRVGFQEQFATQYASQFMGETYVRKRIMEMSHEVPEQEDKQDKAIKQKQIIASLFREANYRGSGASHGARIAALAKLASLHGMDQPTKVEQTINHKGGVMAVPGIAAIDDWETQAMATQEKLTADAEK